MTTPEQTADPNQILQSVTSQYILAPSAYANLPVIAADGGVNLVNIIGEQAVIKVPKTIAPARITMLRNESLALQLLERTDLSPYQTPALIQFSTDPVHLIASFVRGKSMTEEELKQLSIVERQRVGKSFGEYIIRQIAAVDPSTVEDDALDQTVGSWFDFFDSNVGNFKDPNLPSLSRLSESLRRKWHSHTQELRQISPYFIHGDLTIRNVALNDNLGISGVFDWAKAHLGSLAEELSTLINGDEPLFETCLSTLDKNGVAPSFEQVMLWREMKDTSFLIRALDSQGGETFEKFKAVAKQRYPATDWAELDMK
ncbi:MAG TPA: phosphotransferase [Candidatus Saccharimonadales bacterium]|nr:phosphotransferase [Candidatus Saccharimonadales bacterium]